MSEERPITPGDNEAASADKGDLLPICEVSGLEYHAVPGGRIYLIWQGVRLGHFGVFVPDCGGDS